MADDEKQIRELIERWAAAVHAGDLETVLADHAEDIVMFDVPPPFPPSTDAAPSIGRTRGRPPSPTV